MEVQKPLDELINFLNSLSNKWFLTSESCLEVLQSNDIWVKNHPLYIGVYCSKDEVQEILKKMPSPKIWSYKGLPVEATFNFYCCVKVSFFFDFYGYKSEIRINDLINRYRILVYDTNIISKGIRNIKLKSASKEFHILNLADIYCKVMYGNTYLATMQWDRWNSPKNIIWEDHIQKPIRLT